MRLVIHGSGRMGETVRLVALERGHEVVATYDAASPIPDQIDADAIIDFSNAAAIERVVEVAAASRVNLVTGTTGWSDATDRVRARVEESGIACVAASNFSVGANLMFALARSAGKSFAEVGGYEAGLEERHHSRKVDAPSGTALTIARAVEEGSAGALIPAVTASRVGEEFGLHTLFFDSADDVVEISHRARGRTGFARGAVIAAELCAGRSGWLEFSELLSSHES